MISLIAAIGKNNELGKNNDLIWKLKGDMQFFKETTLGHSVIMGYKTYLSIGKPLPKRKNIVICDKKIDDIEGIYLYNDIEDLKKYEINDGEEIFIIGGASMYNYFINYADRLYLTLIADTDSDADTFFPQFNENDYKKTILKVSEENGISYKHILFERKEV